MLRILLAAAVLSTVVGIINEGVATGWMEGFSIFLAVLIISTVTVLNNIERDKQFEKLKEKLKVYKIKVIRDG